MAKETTFGDQLRKWRSAKGPEATQEWLAKQIGRARSYIAQLEVGGIVAPDLATCFAIEGALGITPGGTVARFAAERRLANDDLMRWYVEQEVKRAHEQGRLSTPEVKLSSEEIVLLNAAQYLEERAPGARLDLASFLEVVLHRNLGDRWPAATTAEHFALLLRALRSASAEEVHAHVFQQVVNWLARDPSQLREVAEAVATLVPELRGDEP